MKDIDGYVKITGFELAAKATAVLEYFKQQNILLEQQDVAAQLAWEAKCISDTADLDAYRDSGKAWSDYEKARIKNTSESAIKFCGIRIGTNMNINVYGIASTLRELNHQFWADYDYYNLDSLTFEQINKFNFYELDYQPSKSKKHDTKFPLDLLAVADKTELYLSMGDYQKLNVMWAAIEPQDVLLVG